MQKLRESYRILTHSLSVLGSHLFSSRSFGCGPFYFMAPISFEGSFSWSRLPHLSFDGSLEGWGFFMNQELKSAKASST